MDMSLLWFLLAALLILVGLLGTLLPVLPGLPVTFAGMWLAAWADDYQRVGAGTLVVLGLLVLLSIAADMFASMVGARRVGASGKAVIGAGVGGVVGLFFGLPGLLAGPFLGASLGELWHGRQFRMATRVGFGTWLGLLLGAILKLLLAAVMLAIFFAMLLLG
ncbi:MAG TPA: DUF456 domain-containing protein [Arenimonas sp.]|jgi:uncharacterized protein YqgC (DUF456 family)|nr:DUF456 domain-containing protein [Arenimonas sp.]